jgi:nicotinamidase-related amidase
MSSNAALTLIAKPESITLEPAKTAVLVVDMQNDFGSKGGILDRAGIDISNIRRVVPSISKVLTLARGAGMKIVYLKMGFLPDLSDLGTPESPNRIRHLRFGVGEKALAPGGKEGRFLIRDTWNTEIISELNPQPDDIVLYKSRFSGFYGTRLDEILKELGIANLIVTGCTTSVCVESTIRDAMFRDYRCVLLADCAAEPIGQEFPRSNHEASLLVIQAVLGWVSDSQELIKAVETQKTALEQMAG